MTRELTPWTPGEPVDLWGEDTGSFEFPPRPKTASDVVDFWRTVKIPESAARAVVSRQKLIAHESGVIDGKSAGFAYDDAHKSNASPEERQRAVENGYREGYAKVAQFPQGSVYPSIRAAMMWKDAQYLPEQEREAIRTMPIRFPDGITTPEKVWNTFHFDRLEDELTNSEARRVAALERMERSLNELADNERKRRTDENYGHLV